MIRDALEASSLERAGSAAFPGFTVRTLASTTSTQDVVRTAARSGAAPGFSCLAASQSSGRGRQQRSWAAPAGSSLLASILVQVRHPRLGGVPIAAGLALRAAIEEASGCSTELKWPNDVLARDQKLGGILCEVEAAAPGAATAVAIGVGVNLRVRSFPEGVAGISLHEMVEAPPTATALFTAFLPQLARRLHRLEDVGMAGLRDEWMEHAAGIGAEVIATSGAGTITGVAEGIDDDGALLLRGDAGSMRLLAGDVHIVAQQAR